MADKRTGKRVKFERTKSPRITELDELYNIFYHAKVAEGVSNRTLETYEENYRFFCDYLDIRRIERNVMKMKPELLRDYTTWLLKEKVRFDGHAHKSDAEKTVGLSPVTVNTRTKILRTMFRFLLKERLIESNPWENVAKVEEVATEIKVLTVEQLKELLEMPNQRSYAGFRDYVIMTVLIDGFLRIGEVMSLNKSDIDFGMGTITIRGEVAKTRSSRVVPIQPRTIKLLRELIDETADFDSEYVFLTNYGGKLDENHFRHRLKEYAEQAGINVRVHPHLFRHTAATLFLENGGEVRHLAKILGHRDLRTVMRYTHLSLKSLTDQHNKYSPLNQVFNKLNKDRKILR